MELLPAVSAHLPVSVLVVAAAGPSRSDLRRLVVAAGVAGDAVIGADSLGEARRLLTEHAVDCVVVDLSSPTGVGLAAITVLTAALSAASIVAVVDTGTDPLGWAALAEGAEDVVARADLDAASMRDVLARLEPRRRRVLQGWRRQGQVSVLESISAPTASLDGSGRIVAVNQAWRVAAMAGGGTWAATGIGVNYLKVCDHAVGAFCEGATDAGAGIRAVLSGESEQFTLDYPCPAEGVERWFTLRVNPVGELGGGAVVTHLDITSLRLAEQRLQRDEDGLHGVVDESSRLFALLDARGNIDHLSEASARFVGSRSAAMMGASVFDQVDPLDRDRLVEWFGRVVVEPWGRESLVVRVQDGTGRWRTLQLAAVNLLEDPTVGAVAITGSDVTDGRHRQITRRLEDRLLQRLPVAVIVTDDRGVVVYWNERATAMYGRCADEAVGRPVTELNVGPAGLNDAAAIMAEAVASGRWEGDYLARRADGTLLPVHVTLERVDDPEIGFSGIVGASTDVTERVELERDLAFQASHDPLTGLANRRLFVEHLDTALSRAVRQHQSVAVVFIDLDDFKAVNDRLGHEVGDRALTAVGELISAMQRAGSLVSRLGGDEFVVCCDDLDDPVDAYQVAERIRQVLSAPFRIDGQSVVVTASIGVAVSGESSRPEELLRNADAAMYQAKEAGKNRIEVFDDALQVEARRRRRLVDELRDALDAGEIVTYFQPEVVLATGRLIGFEALARWNHPKREIVLPDQFIPIAEDSELISRLGHQILTDACAAAAAWTQIAPGSELSVSVNASPLQLADPDFSASVRAALADARVDPGRLCIEVTESGLIDPVVALRALRQLKAIGVAIALDDFGTGYSSLSRLHRFPLDFMKIDRSFVHSLTERPESRTIVAAVIGLAAALGLRTIAEGIETETQLAELSAMGCDLGQGYLYGRPGDAATALGIVTSGLTSAPPRSRHPEPRRPTR